MKLAPAVLIAVLCVPFSAFGARIVRIDPPHLYVGDHVTIEARLAFEPSRTPAIAVHNLADTASADWLWNAPGTFRIRGYVRKDENVVIGPFRYQDKNGGWHEEPPLSIRVRGNLVDFSRPVQSLEALHAANRSPVVVMTEVPRSTVYVGENVVVQWWAVGDVDRVSISGRPRNPMQVPGFRSGVPELDVPVRKIDVINATFVNKELLGELRIIAATPGTHTIPSVDFQGEDRSLPAGGPSDRPRFAHQAPPVEVHVLPRPDHARGPIGTFRMECKDVYADGYWPMAYVEVIGSGTVAGHAPPRFLTKPAVPVVIRPGSENLYKGEIRHSWSYEVHASNVNLPGLGFEYFDAMRGVNVELRCDKPPVRRPRHERPPLPPPADNGLPDHGTRRLLECGAITGVAISLYVAIRAFRG